MAVLIFPCAQCGCFLKDRAKIPGTEKMGLKGRRAFGSSMALMNPCSPVFRTVRKVQKLERRKSVWTAVLQRVSNKLGLYL